ncbi:MAG: 2-oxoacid:acceptor oxidoreductase subunit alpha, partial [Anaerolineales bacterium]|nr:2-oxoacid:acceptor oxidoreductase subunit alpha [Anaerolineales bacterium]
EIYAHTDEVNLLMAMNREAFETYRKEINPGGGIIYDQDMKVDDVELQDQGIKSFASPIYEIAEEVGGNRLMGNTAAVAVASGITGFSLEKIGEVIEQNFARKGKQIVESNLRVAELAYDFGKDTYYDEFEYHLELVDRQPRMFINGNHAFSLGALASGCRFVSAYPMTPATTIMEWLAARAEEYGVLVKQTEDEIAAMCMAIGANHMGVRAMTATSGGGFSLMVEALGLAGMTETPVVVVNVQRPGPSTGLATRTEQGDLRFVLHASQGEFPRLVLTPGTVEQAFEAGAQAFNLAEKYQTPVIVLYDQFLGVSSRVLELDALEFERVKIDRGELMSTEELTELEGEYQRYTFTETGISPRALPGSHEKAFFPVTSDEHGTDGHILEDRINRFKMVNKRMRKLESAREDLWQPELYGAEDADVTFVAWGSTYGPLREAVNWLIDDGTSANMLHLSQVWPFPEQRVREILGNSRRVIGVESNFCAQLAGLIREETGIHIKDNILKYDGRPFSPDYIIQCLEEERFNVQTI